MDSSPRSPATSQGRIFLALLAELQPYLRQDRSLPARIQQRLAKERRFGSRDRRLYRELLYTAVRYLPWIEEKLAISEDDALRTVAWLAAAIPATHAFRAAWTGGWPETPPTVAAKAAHLGVTGPLLPAWFAEHCPAATVPPNLDVLHTRAPLWIRLQTDDPAPVQAEFADRGWTTRPATLLPSAWEVLSEADLTTTEAYQNGLIEVQDLGSQLLLAQAALAPGGIWLDACAGAGGKTLQLARLLGSAGRVDAHDIRRVALDELATRARRAGLANIRIQPTPPLAGSLYDGVLIDAPCSGTGTWRRSPHLKWCTQPANVAEAAILQGNLLAQFSRHVRPGGRLLYATCSLSRVENDEVVAAFLATHPSFKPVEPARTLLPAEHNTDGFFIASLVRK